MVMVMVMMMAIALGAGGVHLGLDETPAGFGLGLILGPKVLLRAKAVQRARVQMRALSNNMRAFFNYLH
eukprot:7751728-Karenia_brevis.AAC.1